MRRRALRLASVLFPLAAACSSADDLAGTTPDALIDSRAVTDGSARQDTRPTATDAADQAAAAVTPDARVDVVANDEGVLLAPPRTDFGAVVMGTLSAVMPLLISNQGANALPAFSVRLVGPHSIDFSLDPGQCELQPLAPAASCAMRAVVRPSAAGERQATLEVVMTGRVIASASLVARGVARPQLVATPSEVKLPPTAIGDSREFTLTFTLTSADAIGPLVTRLVAPSGGLTIASDGCGAKTLSPGASCIVKVIHAPDAFGDFVAQVAVGTTAAPLVSVPITGRTPRPPRLTVDRTFVSAAASVSMFFDTVVRLDNLGDSTTGSVAFSFRGTGSNAFSIGPGGDCANRSLAPGATCTFVVRFAPLADTPRQVNATLTVSAQPGGTVDVTLQGSKLGTSLVGHWKLDGNLQDSSGADNHGSVRRGTTLEAPAEPTPTFVQGRVGQALRLEGGNLWGLVPRSASLDSTGDTGQISLSAWVNPSGFATGVQPWSWIATRHEQGTNYEHFGLGLNNGAPACSIHFSFTVATAAVKLNEWVHLAITYDALTCTVYQNGQEVSKLDVGWPIAGDATPFVIGANTNLSTVGQMFSGSIDEVRLYNRVLSTPELAALAAP